MSDKDKKQRKPRQHKRAPQRDPYNDDLFKSLLDCQVSVTFQYDEFDTALHASGMLTAVSRYEIKLSRIASDGKESVVIPKHAIKHVRSKAI